MNMNSSKSMSTKVSMTAVNTRSIANVGMSIIMSTNIITDTSTVTATDADAVAAAAPTMTTRKRKKPSFHLPCSAFRRCL